MKEIKLRYDAYRMEASCADGSMGDFLHQSVAKFLWINGAMIF